ncbi:unnamed protein product [Albugo candida]|uniref:Tc1-like transposase DDE domain-containing protein n=1 Tax=Albugo candida TaxID=65357 RepID=A0A024FX83_9STRA|nr:unnamed protein product [Albugo candida]|eukprot:CCI11631.1 unnamed protein product [Albugo candida]
MRWVKEVNLGFRVVRKGLYIDGHERADVAAYRHEFLALIEAYDHRFLVFSGENMEVMAWPADGVEPLILVTHDERVFSANDGQSKLWLPKGEQPLRKKRQGRSLHVSKFLTDVCGRLALAWKEYDGWWTAEHLHAQVRDKAIPIFTAQFPGAQALFGFDNATSHAAFAGDALVAKRMYLGPGGKQPKMRPTTYGDNVPQSMVYSDDYENEELRGKPKGIKAVLSERGLWQPGLCLPGFVAQRGLLEEVITAAGHKVISYLKFHCELNYVENFWGAAKQYTRKHCNYSWAGLQETVPSAMSSISFTTIRRFACKTQRYMDVYRKILSGKAAEYAVKKYRSHRRIPVSVLMNVNALLN